MSQRVIVGIEPQVDWARLKRELLSAGAASTSDPVSYQPDAVVVTLPDGRDVQAFLGAAKKLAGVRYAEPDVFRSTT